MPAKSPAASNPLVSVVIPAWNAESTLHATLMSVANQTHSNLEIIIVDDGSADRTPQIAEEFCATDTRARLIRKDNGGVASARNRGIFEAKGEWIAPVDADDLWHRTKIEKQLAAAKAAPEPVGFVYCWLRLIDDDDRIILSAPAWEIEGWAFRQLSFMNAVGCGSAFLVRRDAVLSAGGYDESLVALDAQGCEDMLLQLKIARRHPVAVVREYLVGYRQHENAMSNDSERMARSHDLAYARLRPEPVPERAVRWVTARNKLQIANQRFEERKFTAAVAPIVSALRLDPIGSGLLLADVAPSVIVSKLRRRRLDRERLKFDDVDPTDKFGSNVNRTAFGRLLRRLTAKRLGQLAKEER